MPSCESNRRARSQTSRQSNEAVRVVTFSPWQTVPDGFTLSSFQTCRLDDGQSDADLEVWRGGCSPGGGMSEAPILRCTHRGHLIEVVMSQAADGWRAAWSVYRVTPFGRVASGEVDRARRRIDEVHAAAKHGAVAWIDGQMLRELSTEAGTERTTA